MNIEIKEKALKGLELYSEGKINEAEPLLKQAADAGDIDGIYGMGLINLYRGNEYNGIRMLERAISMDLGIMSTLAKLSCGEYYAKKGDFESVYKSVYYYEMALDDEYADMRQNADENLKMIRKQMQSLSHEKDSYYDRIAIEGISLLNQGRTDSAEKMLKMSFIMGKEASWIGLALYYYPNNKNKEALVLLERYIKRSRQKTFLEEAYNLLYEIYEEEGDKVLKKIHHKLKIYIKKLFRQFVCLLII